MIRGLGFFSPTVAEDLLGDREVVSEAIRPEFAMLRDRCALEHGSFVWLGLHEPLRAELDLIGEEFGLPHLLIEDASNPEQRAKVELDEQGHGLVILKVLDYVESTSDVITGQVAIFVGPWFVITVRYGRIKDLKTIRARIAGSEDLRKLGPVSVLYAVTDRVVDEYIVVADEISVDVENLETQVFRQKQMGTAADRIYRLKRENVEIRRAASPMANFAHRLVEHQPDWVPQELRPYFRDIGDHLLRVLDSVESADNLLLTLLMASTSLQDLQQNSDMRKISAWVAIAAVPTMIAGIYGMNFDFMPELHEPWGYPAILIVMISACSLMYRAFRKSGWL